VPREAFSDSNPTESIQMKISSFVAALVIAIALASVGCSASGRINVQNGPSSKLSTDTHVAYVTKPAANPR